MMTRSRTKAERKRKIDEATHKEKSLRLEDQGSRGLLPGIPHDVTTQVISTMLPWSTFYTLSSVSRAWQEAVQSREMFDARVRSHSTEPLAVINRTSPNGTRGLALYSVRDKACYQLPPIPYVEDGIPPSCECITLDGKIYILGGSKKLLGDYSAEVHMLDLAGQRQWKSCASMTVPTYRIGCGVFNGKIYVFCGPPARLVCTGEVYDPKVDAWTPIAPTRPVGWAHKVGRLGNELLVYRTWAFIDNSVDVYDPVNDSWRVPSKERPTDPEGSEEMLFMTDGKLYSLTASCISVIDIEEGSRKPLQSISAAARQLAGGTAFPPEEVLVVDDELLALCYSGGLSAKFSDVLTSSIEDRSPSPSFDVVLVQSRGFGTKDAEIMWEGAPDSFSYSGAGYPFMRPLQL